MAKVWLQVGSNDDDQHNGSSTHCTISRKQKMREQLCCNDDMMTWNKSVSLLTQITTSLKMSFGHPSLSQQQHGRQKLFQLLTEMMGGMSSVVCVLLSDSTTGTLKMKRGLFPYHISRSVVKKLILFLLFQSSVGF